MTWSLIATAVLSLSNPVNMGMAVGTPQESVQAQFDQVHLAAQAPPSEGITEVPFSIDTDEIEGAATIWADIFGDRTMLNGSTSGTFVLPLPLTADAPIMFVTLSRDGGGIVAEDVLVYGVKETLQFDAANAARARVMETLRTTNLSVELLMEAYGQIDEHPVFPELVQLFVDTRGYPEDLVLRQEIGSLSVDITLDLLEELRDDSTGGSSGTALIIPSSVPRSFPFSSFTIEQLEDPCKMVLNPESHAWRATFGKLPL